MGFLSMVVLGIVYATIMIAGMIVPLYDTVCAWEYGYQRPAQFFRTWYAIPGCGSVFPVTMCVMAAVVALEVVLVYASVPTVVGRIAGRSVDLKCLAVVAWVVCIATTHATAWVVAGSQDATTETRLAVLCARAAGNVAYVLVQVGLMARALDTGRADEDDKETMVRVDDVNNPAQVADTEVGPKDEPAFDPVGDAV